MDAAAAALRQPAIGFLSSYYAAAPELRTSSASIVVGRRMPASQILSSGFCDQGHLQYYNSNSAASELMAMKTRISGKQEKATKDKAPKKLKKKKQLKLLKGLSRDLSTFSQMGFGLDSEGLVDQIKGNMITEASELLLEQLQKLKAKEKELKKKMKEEKARLKASQMHNCEMSSSSSSESSDSECGEIIDMNSLKRTQSEQNGAQQVVLETTSIAPIQIMQTITSSEPIAPETNPVHLLPITEDTMTSQLRSSCNVENGRLSETSSSCGMNGGDLVVENMNGSIVSTSSKKIEVCMGGKCKKSGGSALLEKFQKVVGIEGAVSGCKCMGKCRDGPNVKVLNEFDGEALLKAQTPSNSLCIGVGLEDVDMIVSNFLGENRNQLGFAAAS